MWRAANVTFNVVVVWLLAISLTGAVLYTDRGVSIREEAVTQAILEDVGALLPRDLTATTPDGAPIEEVRLYDENGQPVDLDQIRETLERNWGWGTGSGEVVWIGPDGMPADGVPADNEEIDNLYPASRR